MSDVNCERCRQYDGRDRCSYFPNVPLDERQIHHGLCAAFVATVVDAPDEIVHHTGGFAPGKCPTCGHEQHVGATCARCGCTPELAIKADAGKVSGWSLFPWEVFGELLGIFLYGLKKGYLKDSWRKVNPERYEDALMRHTTSMLMGEENDRESGKRHVAHAAWNAVVLMALRPRK